MGLIGIPEKEIKATLANVDATLKQVREDVLPKIAKVDDISQAANEVLLRAESVLARAGELTIRLNALIERIDKGGLTLTIRTSEPSADPQ